MLKKPTSAEQLSYFTRRKIYGGEVTVWVFKGESIANIEYICPFCGHKGEKQKKFERIKVSKIIDGKRKQVQVFRFQCDNCGKNIDLEKWTKKRR